MFEYLKKDFDLCGPVDHKAGFQLVGIENVTGSNSNRHKLTITKQEELRATILSKQRWVKIK